MVSHTRTFEYLRVVGQDSSPMVQMFVVNTIGIVELGRLVMVLAQGMSDRLKERRKEFRAGLIAEGRAELATEIAAWNKRRLEADARGEKFDEPPPME